MILYCFQSYDKTMLTMLLDWRRCGDLAEGEYFTVSPKNFNSIGTCHAWLLKSWRLIMQEQQEMMAKYTNLGLYAYRTCILRWPFIVVCISIRPQWYWNHNSMAKSYPANWSNTALDSKEHIEDDCCQQFLKNECDYWLFPFKWQTKHDW